MIHVAIHPSQYPDQVRRDLLNSLRQREIQHKFHYDTYKQARKWLAVHEAHSPARNDPACLAIYENAFDWVAATVATPLATASSTVHLIGLGCGGGQKDAAFLQRLNRAGCTCPYSAVDVSLPLVITARLRAAPFANSTTGLVCDLETADDIRDELCDRSATRRVLTFFGMMPNSEPHIILPRLAALMTAGDLLLLSANLAPGPDYLQGVKQVLPQYDNAETADWLLTFLYDLGVEPGDGELKFTVEQCPSDLLRIRADFIFNRDRAIIVANEPFHFAAAERLLRLFYSYRYTPDRLNRVLVKSGLTITHEWITQSQDEAIFLVTKQ